MKNNLLIFGLSLGLMSFGHAAGLIASDGATGDFFGQSVSESGTIGLVGAYAKNSSQGAAYVFRGLDTATGTVTQDIKLTASDAATSDSFGWSVSQFGTIGLVGAYTKNSSKGAAYVFRGLDTATGTVTQNIKLTASDAATSDRFGYSVSESGTIGLVGAYGKNSLQGAAYVFRGLDTATGTVTQNVKLTASDGAATDRFGYSVSQSGTIGLVGAFNKNSGQGAAYVFRGLDTATGNITQNVKLTASDGAATDRFGASVSQSGTIGLVGAFNKNSGQGAAYVFRGLDTATGNITQNVKLTASDGAASDSFGWSVSQSGTIGLVGAYTNNSGQGAVYVFRGLDTATGTVTQNVKLTASDGAAGDGFGYSVSESGDQFLIAASSKNSFTGQAYTGTVSSVTTLDVGNSTRTIDGISFVSQDNWIIGQSSSSNQVTLKSGNTGNVTASGKAVYIGQNAGSNNNTLVAEGDLTATQINVGASGNSGNVLQLGTGGTSGTLSTSSVITNNGTVVFNRSDTITQGTQFGSAAITGNGSITQAGSGTTILNAANTYAGDTTINAGTLKAGVANAIPSGAGKGNVVLNGGTSAAGTFDINGFDVSIDGLSGITNTVLGKVVNNATGTNKKLSLGNNDASTTFAGQIVNNTSGTGTVALEKVGSGTQILTGSNTYSGGTSVLAGTLRAGNTSAFGTGDIGVSGGSLDLNGYTVNNALNVSGGSLTGLQNYAGTQAVSGTATYSGTVASTLNVTSGGKVNTTGATFTGAINVGSGGTLGGTGTVKSIAGAGTVGPGNSPGILTAQTLDLTGGADFKFELTTAAPTYSNASASGNDVLHLTDTSAPITGTATSGNVFDIYLNVTTLTAGDFLGGLFTDKTSDFGTLVLGGTYNYYVKGDGLGTTVYNSVNYYTLGEYNIATSSAWTIAAGVASVSSANFASGTVAGGFEQKFTAVVPEPSTYALLLLGIAAITLMARRRRVVG